MTGIEKMVHEASNKNFTEFSKAMDTIVEERMKNEVCGKKDKYKKRLFSKNTADEETDSEYKDEKDVDDEDTDGDDDE